VILGGVEDTEVGEVVDDDLNTDMSCFVSWSTMEGIYTDAGDGLDGILLQHKSGIPLVDGALSNEVNNLPVVD
jgi:hypothetical protein